MTLTATQVRLFDAMKAAVKTGAWREVPSAYGYTIAWDSEERTPAHPELVGWTGPYRAHVFLTLSARKPILGVAKAPWVKRQDQDVTYRRAFEVLEQPEVLV